MDNPPDDPQGVKPTEVSSSNRTSLGNSPSDDDPLLGKVLGNYKILRRLGNGGMATVYAARQSAMERDVAIKVMRQDLTIADPTFFSRFEREAHVTASLEHMHILPVIDFGQAEGHVYLVMRLFDQSLLDYIQNNSPLPLEEVSRLLSQIAEALTYAHEHNVIHRDLKPANVMLDNQKNCYLSDFGIAHLGSGQSLTMAGSIVGTPGYIAPELISGNTASPSSDTYALGIMLYEMLTGRLPFSGETPFIVLNQHLQTTPPLPNLWRTGLPDAVQAVVMQALAKTPEGRFRTPRDLAAAFARAVAGGGTEAANAMSPQSQSKILSSAPSGLQPVVADENEHTFVGPVLDLPKRTPMTEVPHPTQGPAAPTAVASSGFPETAPAAKGRSQGLLVAAIVVLVALVLGGGAFVLSNRATPPPTPTATALPTATIDPTQAASYNDQGVQALQIVDYPSAIKDFQQAIAINPDYAAAYFNLGVAYEENKDLANAQKSYEKAMSLDDRLMLVRYRLAEMLLDENKVDDAFNIIDLAVQILQRGNTQLVDASRAQLTFYLYTTRGRAYEMRYEASKSKTDLSLAESDLLQAIFQKDTVEHPAEAFYYLAKVYDAEGKKDDAMQAWLNVLATADTLNDREREWGAEADIIVNPQTPAATAAQ